MAIRVQNSDTLVFGIMSAQVVVTHGRFQKGGAAPVVRQLAAPLTVPSGERLRLPAGAMDVVYPAGQSNNTHMMAVVNPYWDGETFQIDMMTSDSAVVADSGYSQQTSNAWGITQEAD